jgi:HD-like signal output (HDOD) protein
MITGAPNVPPPMPPQIIPATRLDLADALNLELPAQPRTITEVTQLLSEATETPDTPRLVQIVHCDPVIATAVLRRINSAFYGTRTQIYDIRRAVLLLGFEEVCDIVLASAIIQLKDILASREQEEIYDQILRLSLGTAAFAKSIAQFLNIPYQARAFTTGLMHSIGRIVLLYNKPNDYEALWYTNDRGSIPSTTSEQIIFGIDHAELGAKAADEWHLPKFVGQTVRYYLVPGRIKEAELRLMAMTVSAAAAAAEQFCLRVEGCQQVFQPNAAFFALAKMTGTASADLIEFVETTCREAGSYVANMLSADEPGLAMAS